jgi:transposase
MTAEVKGVESMARYKHYDYRQTKMLPVSYEQQILPGTFEHTLSYLIDEKCDLSVFELRYKNDVSGAPAYDPAILLKIVLFAYSRGITYSRKIEALCRENIVFMALSADSQPHFTTIADFISSSPDEIARIFRDVLLVCDEAGLLGREMFAIDGLKLPSNASKEWSGKKQELQKKAQKIQRAMHYILSRHRTNDEACEDSAMRTAQDQQLQTLQHAIQKIESFLATHQEKIGRAGKEIQSNITDNESAKMPTSKGVVQGYTGVAIADSRHQVIVEAQAFGEGQEHGVLIPMLEATRTSFRELALSGDILKETKLTADAGYSSEANAKYLLDHGIDAYVADTNFRKRDPRFKDAERHKPTREDEPFAKPKVDLKFQPKDFQLAPDHSHAICPAGKRMYCCARPQDTREYQSVRFRAPISACANCPLRAGCIRHPERTRVRQVAFFFGRTAGKPEKYLARMQRKIDSDIGRYEYSRRLGIIEPVFGNIRNTKRLSRFTLRGRRKVNAQWQLYCLVHNIEKLQRYGLSQGPPKRRAKRAA